MTFDRIAVLGAGAWGTALANAAVRAGRTVTLWGRGVSDDMAASRESPRLPGIKIEDSVEITRSIGRAAQADLVLLALPAQVLRPVCRDLRLLVRAGTPVVACAKGIERETRKFMTEVIKDVAPNTLPAVLSGPSFASDVGRGLPTAVTVAVSGDKLAAAIARALGSSTFRVYHSTDVRGVEIGGAAKNVLAIGAGIVQGRGLGPSAAAALTTRGFAELFRFGKEFGARPETLVGLSGLGDLILSCSSTQSRNFSLGIKLGEGRTSAEARGEPLAEGASTASVLVELARGRGLEMPIAEAVASVLDGRITVDGAIESLLTRPFRAEG